MSGKGCDCVCHKLGYMSCIGHCDEPTEQARLATHLQHAVPAVEHRACTCGARKTREHCTCKHSMGDMQDHSDTYCI